MPLNKNLPSGKSRKMADRNSIGDYVSEPKIFLPMLRGNSTLRHNGRYTGYRRVERVKARVESDSKDKSLAVTRYNGVPITLGVVA